MDERYKSVTVKREHYQALVALAKKNHRTIAGQLAALLELAKKI